MSASVATAAVGAVPPSAATVEVVGEGGLAQAVREQLAERTATAGAAPAAVIDTTGDPAEIESALGRVDDLGTVVLAGPAPEATIALDLYVDIHVRGLTVIGLAGSDEKAE